MCLHSMCQRSARLQHTSAGPGNTQGAGDVTCGHALFSTSPTSSLAGVLQAKAHSECRHDCTHGARSDRGMGSPATLHEVCLHF